MIESMTEIATPEGRMDGFVVRPDGGPFPAVLLLMDIWGLREELFGLARKVAAAGYHCTVPNFYYRQGPVRFEFRDAQGRMKSFENIAAEEQQRMRAQMGRITDDLAMKDLRSILDFLNGQKSVKAGPKASVGFCLGGRYAVQSAALYPDEFRAGASLHGTRLATDAPLSPHKLAAACRGEIYCGFAEHDDLAPPATRKALQAAFAANPHVRYTAVVHKGAAHGYALPNRDVFDERAAEQDWENIFSMFRRMLTA